MRRAKRLQAESRWEGRFYQRGRQKRAGDLRGCSCPTEDSHEKADGWEWTTIYDGSTPPGYHGDGIKDWPAFSAGFNMVFVWWSSAIVERTDRRVACMAITGHSTVYASRASSYVVWIVGSSSARLPRFRMTSIAFLACDRSRYRSRLRKSSAIHIRTSSWSKKAEDRRLCRLKWRPRKVAENLDALHPGSTNDEVESSFRIPSS